MDNALCPFTQVTPPSFKTEVVTFEDNFLFSTAAGSPNLVYRVDGAPTGTRTASPAGGSLLVKGNGGYVHPAQYRHATLKLTLSISGGEPEIAFAHNGLTDNTGAANSEPGFKVVLATTSTNIVDLKTGVVYARLKQLAPRGLDFSISISWDLVSRVLRLDFPGGSYSGTITGSLSPGGFALRSSRPETSYTVKKAQVLWQDDRRLLLYDEYDSLSTVDGVPVERLPSAKLPTGMTQYGTVVVDLIKARSFIYYGGSDLNSNVLSTVKGFGVRDLKTGTVDLLPAPLNGCMLLQGGGGLDGYALIQSWVTPASLCWLDWNAYDRGDLANFAVMTPYHASGSTAAPPFIGFHDSDSALDGSIARYLRITENWQGITHFIVHPNLARFAAFTDQAVPAPLNQQSQTGPDAHPTGLVVRDRDRALYELWSYLGTVLHTQMRGYNLFGNSDDWAGPLYPGTAPANAYTDYANTAPSLTQPGKYYAPLILWTPNTRTAAGQSLDVISLGATGFSATGSIPQLPIKEHSPIQILWP